MAERYTKVFAQQGQFYCQGAPVIIEAGALLKDNQTGKIIAQVKFKNISTQNIRALTVRISAWDVSGNVVAGVDNFQYLDLNVSRDGTFGAKNPIALPDAVARSFTCECRSVVFTNGNIWNCEEDAQWTVLPTLDPLHKKIGTGLIEQYRRDTTSKAEYVVTDCEDLWYCACGAINHSQETLCHHCRSKKAALLAALNIDILSANKKNYDDAVAARQAEIEAEQQRRNQKNKKIGIIAGVALALLVAIVLLITKVIIPANDYKKANELLNKGEFGAAEEAFQALAGYKDSDELMLHCQQKQLEEHITADDFLSAQELVTELSDYQPTQDYLLQAVIDSINNGDYVKACHLVDLIFAQATQMQQAMDALYNQASAYYEQKDFDSANYIFSYLGDYKDSQEKLHTHSYSEPTILIEATCENEGKEQQNCSCGSVLETVIPATGHNYVDATCTAPKTCSVCGKTEGNSLGHTTYTGICERCYVDFRTPPATLEQLQGTWIFRYDNGWYKVTINGTQGTFYFKQQQDFEYGYHTGPVTITKDGFKVGPGDTYWHYPNEDVYVGSNSWHVFFIVEFNENYFIDSTGWKFVKE